jgi:electron transport complex protein RnfC
VGDPLSESVGFVSVPVHASISGTVTAIENRPHPIGPDVLSIVIESDGEDLWCDHIGFQEDYLGLDKKEMLSRIREAGLAGMGGATFPTHVKLSPPGDKPIDTLLLNGAECEPYLTSDHRLMLESSEKIVRGMQILMKILGARTGVIGIESNKSDAVRTMRKAVAALKLPYKVYSLHVKYPQGAEKQLIKAVTQRRVPNGGLPMDVGCVVQNIGTAFAVYEAVAEKKPLIDRIVTVVGPGIGTPGNIRTRIGTLYSHLFEFCGGLSSDAGKIILGGPMMGLAQYTDQIPVIKGTSGLVVLTEKQSRRRRETACISCARCVDVCPMRLLPTFLAKFVRYERLPKAELYNILDCIECGSCAYVCPSHIDLVHFIKFGKNRIVASKREKESV